MFLFHRKALAGIGLTATAVASTALFAIPAQAASTGVAKVHGSAGVDFAAAKGKANSLTITISGRTVTLDDKVAIKAGKGCKPVKGDKTKVKCKTPKKTRTIWAALGDKNDLLVNKTSLVAIADGGAGNDNLTGGSGLDFLDGGAGNDKLYGRAGHDWITGGTGDDFINGGSGNDILDGNAGNDKVYGDAGNDDLLGFTGTDWLSGGVGNDRLFGEAGIDFLYGDAGDDEIQGDAGNDVISGAAGNDDIIGGVGNDRISGGVGADYLYGEAGNDVLGGDAGDDHILGEAGNDTATGGAGDDTVVGAAGNDTLGGGAGDDVLIGENVIGGGVPAGSDTALDKLDGGANAVAGDICLVKAAGTTVNCEFTEAATVAARTSAAVKSAESVKAALQNQVRASRVRPAK